MVFNKLQDRGWEYGNFNGGMERRLEDKCSCLG
jgi:hypothetical protein